MSILNKIFCNNEQTQMQLFGYFHIKFNKNAEKKCVLC